MQRSWPKVLKSAVIFIALAGFLSACQTTAPSMNPDLVRGEDVHRVLMMPIDIEISELGIGVKEPRADWTKAAEGNIESALESGMQDVRTSQLSAANFGSKSGFRLEIEAYTESGLATKGFARGVIEDSTL